MNPGERTKAYKIYSVKNFYREKGPIEHEDMAFNKFLNRPEFSFFCFAQPLMIALAVPEIYCTRGFCDGRGWRNWVF